ncbi:amino acid ABC transporter permease [Brevibacterium ravenspurgense]|uniref:Amino acid ABC transporter permease n=1 Tax=Brevibacterium ravenspurgense TaxID=479117 RepID=A0A2I1IJM1_9MICO|nr:MULTISPECIES: amino acid ABC transporter permease [Brevibacterium]MCG7299920.1 amino acid ABC transporter permease [Brevibacterium ravenspurgense]PKY71311.1 amino acid ABC transporter permease [Brevibacterium ravenspurgense]
MRTEPFVDADGTQRKIIAPIPWGRIAVGGLAILFVAWVLSLFVFNERILWSEVAHYFFYSTILSGIGNTLWISVIATLVGLVLGVVLAIMKLSHNPVLRAISEVYLWIFRGTPVLVQLVFWFNLAFLLPYLIVKIPFTMIGVFWETNALIGPTEAAILGLGLNMAAYFAETVRAGIQAVDVGQTEAALAGGLTRRQTMRLVVLPQALRIIIPPTANEFISMLKTTSLVMIVAGHDLMTNAAIIYKQNNLIIELLIVVSIWYMIMTAIATFLQSLLEKRFGKDRVRSTRGATWAQKLVGQISSQPSASASKPGAEKPAAEGAGRAS